jgi:hypothetical protein
MFILYYILCAIVGVTIGLVVKNQRPNCNHKWVLFKSTTIDSFRNGQEVQVGYVKFYECEHCKKMKKEEIRID